MNIFIKAKKITLLFILAGCVIAGVFYFTKSKPETETGVPAYTANVTVDYSKDVGKFNKYLFGALGSPIFEKNGFLLTKNASFKTIQIFLAMDMPLNPDDPSQYKFSDFDRQIEEAVNNGLEPMIMLPFEQRKPDLAKHSTFVKNTARHFTQGWGNGHYWNVKLFRFGNEPDNAEFWKGTKQELFEYYAATAKSLKEVNPDFIAQAPGIMKVFDAKPEEGSLKNADLSNWVVEFLAYNDKNNVPLDIFTFHQYGPFIWEYYNAARAVQKELQKYPKMSPLYGIPKLGNDEWNIELGEMWSGKYSRQFDTAWPAPYYISAIGAMIEGGELHASFPMTGTFGKTLDGGSTDFLLVDAEGKGKPAYYAFRGFNQLAGASRLSASGSDYVNFSVMAGKNDDEIIIVLSNFDVKNYTERYYLDRVESLRKTIYDTYVSKFGQPKIYNKYNLILNNLPWSSSDSITYERYVVDDSKKLEAVETETITGGKTLSFSEDITAPSVQIVKLRKK